MALVTVNATKLEEANVSYISLVKRGANRIPFRVIKSDKQEKDMINLASIFKADKTVKAEKPTVGIMGIVVEKCDHNAQVQEAIKKAGLDFNFMEEREDGTVVFKATEAPLEMEGLQIVKMSDDTVVLMKGFDPYSDILTFMDAANAQGFYPAIGNAFDALRTVTSKALRESASPEEAVTKMGEILGEFTKYVLDAANKIPAVAFKADDEVSATLKAEKSKSKILTEQEMKDKGMSDVEIKAYMEKNKVTPAAKADEPTGTDASAVTDTGTTETTVKAEGDKPTEPATDMAAVIKAALDAALAPLTEALSTVTGAVDAVTKQVSDMAEVQTTLTSKVAEVETVAKSASDSMKGIVIGSVPADDTQRHSTTTKSVDDEDPRTGVFDTAFISKSARGGKR